MGIVCPCCNLPFCSDHQLVILPALLHAQVVGAPLLAWTLLWPRLRPARCVRFVALAPLLLPFRRARRSGSAACFFLKLCILLHGRVFGFLVVDWLGFGLGFARPWGSFVSAAWLLLPWCSAGLVAHPALLGLL
jgi:hypothetical protein